MKNNSIRVCLLIAIGFVLFSTSSCEKNETEDETKKDPIITWENPAHITYGTLLSKTQLNAIANIRGTFIYTPPIGTLLVVGLNQELKVDFIPTDGKAYNLTSKTVLIDVLPSSGTLSDIEDNEYNYITIGTQTWMVENLRIIMIAQ